MATTVHPTFLESKPQSLCLPRHGFIRIVLVLKRRSKQVKIPGMPWKQPECRLDVTFCQQQPRVTLPNHGYCSFKMVNISLNTAGDQYGHLPMSPGGRTGDGFPLSFFGTTPRGDMHNISERACLSLCCHLCGDLCLTICSKPSTDSGSLSRSDTSSLHKRFENQLKIHFINRQSPFFLGSSSNKSHNNTCILTGEGAFSMVIASPCSIS